MVNFKSVTGVGLAADQLIRSYAEFAGDAGLLSQTTDTSNSPRLVIELRALRTAVVGYRDRAQAITASATFAELDPNVQDDIRLIAEECAAAVEEIDEEVEPNGRWAKLSEHEKEGATQRLQVDSGRVAGISARLRHQKRGLPPARRNPNQ